MTGLPTPGLGLASFWSKDEEPKKPQYGTAPSTRESKVKKWDAALSCYFSFYLSFLPLFVNLDMIVLR